jgi:hypothetical protein
MSRLETRRAGMNVTARLSRTRRAEITAGQWTSGRRSEARRRWACLPRRWSRLEPRRAGIGGNTRWGTGAPHRRSSRRSLEKRRAVMNCAYLLSRSEAVAARNPSRWDRGSRRCRPGTNDRGSKPAALGLCLPAVAARNPPRWDRSATTPPASCWRDSTMMNLSRCEIRRIPQVATRSLESRRAGIVARNSTRGRRGSKPAALELFE